MNKNTGAIAIMVKHRLRSRMVASIPLLLALILSCSLTEKTEKQGEEAEASEEEVVILGEFDRDWILSWNPERARVDVRTVDVRTVDVRT